MQCRVEPIPRRRGIAGSQNYQLIASCSVCRSLTLSGQKEEVIHRSRSPLNRTFLLSRSLSLGKSARVSPFCPVFAGAETADATARATDTNVTSAAGESKGEKRARDGEGEAGKGREGGDRGGKATAQASLRCLPVSPPTSSSLPSFPHSFLPSQLACCLVIP